MTDRLLMNRRKLLRNVGVLGCSLAASPIVTPMVFASPPVENRLVVIILRGAMDGLDVVRPVGDPDYLTHRPGIGASHALDLNGMFALHAELEPLMPLWRSGELGFAQALSTPYRDGRSHFDGQDMLEAGQPDIATFEGGTRNGWLNRMMTLFPDARSEMALAVGQRELLLLSGDANVTRWSPGQSMGLSPETEGLLAHVYADDPLFHTAAAQANAMSDQMGDDMMGGRRVQVGALAEFAADRLNDDARIAAFSINGWDTHRTQAARMRRPLRQLSNAILTLKSKLGANWGRTAVLCMTEFGRTARQNGSGGTDHGTGGAMVLAGGAVRGGQVFTNWPGLGPSELYQDRDLMPTADVRAYAAMAMQDLYGLSGHMLENTVFPGLDISTGQRIIL
jgi:uncharacterized protein (DUF1501 family)